MTKRVVVFIDYQNVYHSARETFHSSTGSHWVGQINPRALGSFILDLDNDTDRVLKEVRIYRGLPSNSKDPKGYGAARPEFGGSGGLVGGDWCVDLGFCVVRCCSGTIL